MKAMVYGKYGGPEVLELKEVDRPVPGNGQVLIKVHAASVNYADLGFMRGKPFVVRPKNNILGSDIAGILSRRPEAEPGCSSRGMRCSGIYPPAAGAVQQSTFVHMKMSWPRSLPVPYGITAKGTPGERL